MSDTQGDRPDESTPDEFTAASSTPAPAADAVAAEPQASAPTPLPEAPAALPTIPVQESQPPAAPGWTAPAATSQQAAPAYPAPYTNQPQAPQAQHPAPQQPAAPVPHPTAAQQQHVPTPQQPAAPVQPAGPQQPRVAAPQQPAVPQPQYPQQHQPYGAPQPQYGAPHAQPYGVPAAQQPYGAPRPPQAQGYAGQPPAGYPAYATGSAFGPGAQNPAQAGQTQPTLPLPGQPTTDRAPRAAKRKVGAGTVVGLVVAAALVGGAAGLGGSFAGANLWSTSAAAPASGPSTITVNNTESVNATTAIAAKVLPSVVTIDVSGGNSGGTGSGVILNTDGYVATNTHVVTLDGATSDGTIRVTTSDGRVFDATVVGTDPTYDLAVIKLKDATNLTPIDFGDSSKLNVGDQTVAIGAPLGLSNTVTTGIVSALNRSIQIASSAAPDSSDSSDGNGQGGQGDQNGQNGQNGPFFFDIPGQGTQQPSADSSISIAVIQTDAAINPGNSGGALVNSDGKLIGINVAIATAGGTTSGQSGSIGVGFSIPSDIVKRVTSEIIDNGTATHGLLGASVQAAASVEGSTITGAYIQQVTDGGAAAAAGLQKGDIVTAFNGVPISDSIDLTAQVRAAAAGSKATVTFVRGDKSQTVDVTLGTLAQ